MGETVMTKVWGEQPVIDTWTDCRNVKKGWCGKSKRDGVVHTVVYDPRAQLVPRPIARMPDEDHFVVQKDGLPIGAIRIEVRAVPAGVSELLQQPLDRGGRLPRADGFVGEPAQPDQRVEFVGTKLHWAEQLTGANARLVARLAGTLQAVLAFAAPALASFTAVRVVFLARHLPGYRGSRSSSVISLTRQESSLRTVLGLQLSTRWGLP